MNDNLLVYKSLEPEHPKWEIFSKENGKIVNRKADFGGIVFQCLNTINHILKSNVENEDEQTTETSEFISFIKNNLDEYNKNLMNIRSFLSDRTMSDTAKFRFYDEYRLFAVLLFQGISFEEYLAGYRKSKKTPYPLEENIVFKGYDLKKDIKYAVYEVTDVSWLFALDLWETIFNPTLKTVACEGCGDFFMTTTLKSKYCPECNIPSNRNKRIYIKRKENDISRLRQRINEMLSYYNLTTYDFSEEVDYYLAVINNEKIDINPKYDSSITSEADLVAWLNKKHESLKGYNKKQQKEQNDKSKE